MAVHTCPYTCCRENRILIEAGAISLGVEPSKTWTLDWTHELTDIWTPDNAINDGHDTYAMYLTMPLQCLVYQQTIWRPSKIMAVCTVPQINRLSIEYTIHSRNQAQVMLKLIHFIMLAPNSIAVTLNFHVWILSGQTMDFRALN